MVLHTLLPCVLLGREEMIQLFGLPDLQYVMVLFQKQSVLRSKPIKKLSLFLLDLSIHEREKSTKTKLWIPLATRGCYCTARWSNRRRIASANFSRQAHSPSALADCSSFIADLWKPFVKKSSWRQFRKEAWLRTQLYTNLELTF